jgi:hypothetical protein
VRGGCPRMLKIVTKALRMTPLHSRVPPMFYSVTFIFSHTSLFLDVPHFSSIQFVHTFSLLYLSLSLYSLIAYISPLTLIHFPYSSISCLGLTLFLVPYWLTQQLSLEQSFSINTRCKLQSRVP